MIILGLGSNLGERLSHLRQAYAMLEQIPELTIKAVSPIYESDALMEASAPQEWALPFLNVAIGCEATLEPRSLRDLIKTVEHAIGRKPTERWAPRTIDIDILAWDDLVINEPVLTIPHSGLFERSFALWPLADIAPHWVCPVAGPNYGKTAYELVAEWGSPFTGEAPLSARQINQSLVGPKLAGILNITADSFADGGEYLALEKAQQQFLSMVEQGAEVIDIGAVATNPNITALTDQQTEWRRLEPFLSSLPSLLKQARFKVQVSLDSFYPETLRAVSKYPVDWVNDQTGMSNPENIAAALELGADVVIMHQLNIPEDRNQGMPMTQDTVATVLAWAREKIDALTKAGLNQDKIIIDPGVGFGKNAVQSLEVIRHADAFTELGCRVMLGYSRKSMFNLFTTRAFSQRTLETAIVSGHLTHSKVDYLRVHDVEDNYLAMKIARALA